MSEPSGAPLILIVEPDVALLLWLGELFNEAGYRSVPALNCRQALARISETGLRVALLIVNPHLRGVARLIDTLSRVQAPKVVLIQSSSTGAEPPYRFHATLDASSSWGPVSRAEWRLKVQRLLDQVGMRAAS